VTDRLVVAFPMYRQVSVNWFFQWLQLKKDHVVGTVATEGIYLPQAMATLVDLTYKHFGDDWDRVVVYEHDMIPPLDALNRISTYGDAPDGADYDIVGTTYFKHDAPHHVMAWMQVKPPMFSPLTAEVTRVMVDNPALYPVDGVAMGLTSIHRRVFEGWDPRIPMWDAQPPLVGHDLWFCHAARQQGFKVWLDSGIGCGHLTEVPIGYGHSQAALAIDPDVKTWEQAREAGLEDVPLEIA